MNALAEPTEGFEDIEALKEDQNTGGLLPVVFTGREIANYAGKWGEYQVFLTHGDQFALLLDGTLQGVLADFDELVEADIPDALKSEVAETLGISYRVRLDI